MKMNDPTMTMATMNINVICPFCNEAMWNDPYEGTMWCVHQGCVNEGNIFKLKVELKRCTKER